jgi:ATP-dependent protease ClpP protease subunit
LGFTPDWALQVEDLIAAIEQLQQQGVRVLVLSIGSPGGIGPAGFALFNALKAFSRAGGTVIVHVDHVVGSVASFVILAADYIVMSPDAEIVVHGARDIVPHGERKGSVAGPTSASGLGYRLLLAVYATETLVPRETLEQWLSQHEEDGRPPATVLDATAAVSYAFADSVGDLRDAEDLAMRVAAGTAKPSPRRAALAARGAVSEYWNELETIRQSFTVQTLGEFQRHQR